MSFTAALPTLHSSSSTAFCMAAPRGREAAKARASSADAARVAICSDLSPVLRRKSDSVVIHLDGKVHFLTDAQIEELYAFVLDYMRYPKKPMAIKSAMKEDFIRTERRNKEGTNSLEFRYDQRRRYVGEISYFTGKEYDAILFLGQGMNMPALYLDGRYDNKGGSVLLLSYNSEKYKPAELTDFLRELCF